MIFDKKKLRYVVAGNGSACVISFQVAKLMDGQRLLRIQEMHQWGYDLPAAIGACISRGSKSRVICLAGVRTDRVNTTTIGHHQNSIRIWRKLND
jgi:hypothetical protein